MFHNIFSLNDLPNEVWKDIPSYESIYQVSNLGRIKSLERRTTSSKINRVVKERIIKQVKSNGGYLQFGLYYDGKLKRVKTHRIVIEAFTNNLPNGNLIVVDHKNNNKLDNRIDNLQVITQRKNASKNRKGTSKYTGVFFDKRRLKWCARIVVRNRKWHLGYFEDEYEAHLAYQKALKKLNNELSTSNNKGKKANASKDKS